VRQVQRLALLVPPTCLPPALDPYRVAAAVGEVSQQLAATALRRPLVGQ
jgi:hypothetical protein